MNKSDFFTADAVKPHFTYDDYCESADMIASHLGDFRPEVLLVLGSGLGFLGDRVEARTCVSYADIPHFRASTAPGHEGRFVFGELRGKRVAVMQGRMHCYEGYTMEDAAYACRVIRLLGAKTMIVTNAAGAVNTEYSAGDLMLISDHIKLFDFGPLWGPNIDARRGEHLDRQRAERQRIALAIVFEIGDEVGHRVVVDAGGVGVRLADVDGHVRQRLFERRHGERVVAVSVGQQNIFERDALALHKREQFFRLVARVDERGGLRFLVDEQVAILSLIHI